MVAIIATKDLLILYKICITLRKNLSLIKIKTGIQSTNFTFGEPEIRYVFNTYLSILGVQNLHFQIEVFEQTFVKILISTPEESKCVKFKLTEPGLVKLFLNKEISLRSFNSIHTVSKVPFFGEDPNWIKFDNFDFFSIPFIELSRIEEYYSTKLDKHGRFKFEESLAYHYNYFKIAIVDEYALIFKELLLDKFNSIIFRTQTSSVITTHDIDEIERFPSLKLTLRTLIGDLILYKSLALLFRSLIQLLKKGLRISGDPYTDSIIFLADESQKRGLKSIFFFMASNKNEFDKGYELHKLIPVFEFLKSKDISIGFHPGYFAYDSLEVFKKQLQKLEIFTGLKIDRSRQHYLRFNINKTIKILIDSGIKIDYTLGYAEQQGFRSGTSHRHKLYNISERSEFDLEIQPLIAMDVTLTEYQKYTDKEALDVLLDLKRKVDVYNGTFTILWHNAYVTRERERFEKIYLNFLNLVTL
ncbi:MAG: hypothetical protein RLZZ546_1168 [Bacteroidota bacterium]